MTARHSPPTAGWPWPSGQGLQVVNLADGRVRWQRRIAASPALTAAGGLVIYGLNGHLTGYDARTGRPRWVIAPGMSPDPEARLAGRHADLRPVAAGAGFRRHPGAAR